MTLTKLLPDDLSERLAASRRRWAVTGAAGFIGSNLIEALLACEQDVVGIDNFSTGHRKNIEDAVNASPRFRMIEGDIRDRQACAAAVEGCDIVLHQAALGSVPRSLAEPLTTHDANVTGFVNMLDAARIAGVKRFIYAASSSTYGDLEELPKVEERTGRPLSPYAASKLINEVYAEVYRVSYDFRATGLRYFNVFGPRQDPEGAYAAVIPKWVAAMIADQPVTINGDGETSRDFCFVANAAQANVLAALAPDEVQGEVFNVAFGGRTSLTQLFELIRDELAKHQVHYDRCPAFAEFRAGDVRHSQADIGKAQRLLGYLPTHNVEHGLAEAVPHYLKAVEAGGRAR